MTCSMSLGSQVSLENSIRFMAHGLIFLVKDETLFCRVKGNFVRVVEMGYND